MQQSFRYLFLALIFVLTAGCVMYIPKDELYNNTGKELTIIVVNIRNRRKAFILNSKQSALIGSPYEMEVQFANTTWHYNDMFVPLKFHKYVGTNTWLANLQIQENGAIYLLSPDSIVPAKSFPPQPAEFPLEPEK